MSEKLHRIVIYMRELFKRDKFTGVMWSAPAA
jgi:hypothetical protein